MGYNIVLQLTNLNRIIFVWNFFVIFSSAFIQYCISIEVKILSSIMHFRGASSFLKSMLVKKWIWGSTSCSSHIISIMAPNIFPKLSQRTFHQFSQELFKNYPKLGHSFRPKASTQTEQFNQIFNFLIKKWYDCSRLLLNNLSCSYWCPFIVLRRTQYIDHYI